MQMANPTRSSVVQSSPRLETPRIDVTPEEVRTMMLYLRKARDRAIDIRDRSPGGSYLESVLDRTIDGLTLELSQLDYLLASEPAAQPLPAGRRMRPAI
ncbi:hypothetical protein QW131_03700 [Roseibium salinum]|nr:hypothetical protein [Roseibium salinum]